MNSSTGLKLTWRRSESCGSHACVEVARMENAYYVRDSKFPDGPVLRFSLEEWDSFAAGIANGDFAFE